MDKALVTSMLAMFCQRRMLGLNGVIHRAIGIHGRAVSTLQHSSEIAGNFAIP